MSWPSLTAARATPAWTLRPGADRWLAAWLAVALAAALAPLAASACCAPVGHTGLGSVWFINDFAQYESAMQQAAHRADWLLEDPFTAEPHSPAFMFPLYVGLGKLAALTGAPAASLERGVEVAARGVLVLALWRFVRRFAASRSAARAAFLLALFGGGFGILAAVIGAVLGRPPEAIYSGSWSYETNSFGLLYAAPHVPLAMAASLELARWLLPGGRAGPADLLRSAGLGAVVALLHPFHVPVLLSAMGLVGLWSRRTSRGSASLAAALAAAAGALPALAPTAATFSLDPFWSATYSRQNLLPSPAPPEALVDLGITLVLAAAGVALLRQWVAPWGLCLWLGLAVAAMYLPLPYQRRFAFGFHPALAVLAANTLVALGERLPRAAGGALRLGVVALASVGTLVVFASLVGAALTNAPLAVYRSTPDLDRAAEWLAAQARPGEVILADWDVGNYLAPRTPARVLGGHPVATVDPAARRRSIEQFFAAGGSLHDARRLGVSWIVYGPAEADQPGPAVEPTWRTGAVRIYRAGGSP